MRCSGSLALATNIGVEDGVGGQRSLALATNDDATWRMV